MPKSADFEPGSNTVAGDPPGSGAVAGTATSKPSSQAPTPLPPPAAGSTPSNTAGLGVDDDFEIIDPPPPPPAGSASAPHGTPLPHPPESAATPTTTRVAAVGETTQPGRRYRTLAVRPAASVMPLLTNLLSPFVMGITKSARAAASTTAEVSRPTALPGTALLLTSFTFAPPATPHPPVLLTVHNLPTATPASIFLEAELESEEEPDLQDEAEMQRSLQAFLEGCLPEGVEGIRKYAMWDEDAQKTSWQGVERTRKASQMLARLLRDGGFA